ncbi:MAG: RsmD family RNA methyltransferase [Bacteroidetes bacterium]|nr:RsmD family RNA methyltransferase [Bacteroidota bacterium]
MRIIAGIYKNYRFPMYKGDNTRPTTDMVKESLFGILEGLIDFNQLKVVDIFAGTGNIGLEFISRNAENVLSIDSSFSNFKYISAVKKELKIKKWDILKLDAIKFIEQNTDTFDIIFADPPYDYPLIHNFVNSVLDSELFNKKTCYFILEHIDRLKFEHKCLFLKKDYGNTCFSIFKSK